MTAMPAAPTALDNLIATLTPEPLEDNLFRGPRSSEGWQRVYGGLVLGQSLAAAALTVDPTRPIHSLHGYFLLAGDPERDIIYDVERIRDGGSFTTRRVRAIQHGRAIFSMSASFHKAEEGYDHQSTMPDVPPPESLPSAKELMSGVMANLPENMRTYWRREHPIDEPAEDLGVLLHWCEAAHEVERWLAGSRAVGQGVDAVAVVGQQRAVGLPVVCLVRQQTVDQDHRVRVCRGWSARPVVRAGRRRV